MGAGLGARVGWGRILPIALAVVALVVALLAASGSVSPQPALAKAGKGKRVIVRPKHGKRVRRYPVSAVVNGRDGLFDVKARLNGKRIEGAFGRTSRGRRTARLSRSHGLKRGRNVLRVKSRRRIGQRRRKATVRFVVPRKRPLAGAGRDRRIAEGVRFRLRGGALPYPRTPKVRAQRRVNYRWKITRAPKESRFRNAATSGSARAAGRPLTNATAPRPGFTPDVRGQYRFKLRVTDGARSSSDEVRLNAVPGTPFVPIETMDASKAFPAITVGGKSYSQAVEDPWLQVLVLDRSTLGFVSNKTYSCAYPFDCGPAVAQDLSKLDDSKLVIAVSQPGFVRPYDLPRALAPIGFPNYDENPFETAPSGTVSVIGVPGLPAGHADFAVDLAGPPGIANIDDYLTPNQFFDYTLLPKERPPYDTRESNTVANGNFGNVMEIAGDKYLSAGIGSLPGAMQVLVFDGITLDLVDNETYTTNCFPCSEGSTTYVDRMRRRLLQVNQGQIVFITSMVTSSAQRPVGQDTAPAAFNDLANAIAGVGGTRDTFFKAASTSNAAYTLVGWGNAGETNGEESDSVTNSVAGAGGLQGALVPNNESLFRPFVASVGEAPNETLMQLALQPERPWPLDGNADAQRAITWIGSQNKKLGPDPRSAYWIQDLDQSSWNTIATQVGRLKYKSGLGFSKASFAAAQSELVQEITYVGEVRDYLSDLSQPFSEVALQSWAKLTTISDQVQNALKPPPDSKAGAIVMDIVRGLYGLIGIPGKQATEVVAELYKTALDVIAETRGGDDMSDINVQADELAAQMVDRLQNAQQAMRSLGDILVSDYTKLSTTAINERCNPEDANCPPEWQFTAEDKQAAAASVYKGIETLFDEQFMAIAFPAYSLTHSPNHHNAKQWTCLRTGDFRFSFQPFNDSETKQVLPDNGQAELTVAMPGTYQVYALGSVFPDMSPFKMTVPPAGILNRMFSPASSSLDPTEGGLAIYRPEFMLQANPRNYPADADCNFPGG